MAISLGCTVLLVALVKRNFNSLTHQIENCFQGVPVHYMALLRHCPPYCLYAVTSCQIQTCLAHSDSVTIQVKAWQAIISNSFEDARTLISIHCFQFQCLGYARPTYSDLRFGPPCPLSTLHLFVRLLPIAVYKVAAFLERHPVHHFCPTKQFQDPESSPLIA